MKSYIKILLFLLLAISIYGFIWYQYNVAYWSYLSVESVCNPVVYKEVYAQQYPIAASFVVSKNVTNTTTNVTSAPTTKIVYYAPKTTPVTKHEECHKRQYEQKRLFNCNIPLLFYFNEQECYIIQRYYELYA
mgnify:CR=1 FL=1